MKLINAQQALQSLIGGATVQTVYGEPIPAFQKTIIPVATVKMGFGGGYGEGHGTSGKPPTNVFANGQGTGGGMGGGLMIEPIGIIEITAKHTRYRPLGVGRYVGLGLALGWILGRIATHRSKKR